jgi:hypothetical protein
MRFRLQLSAIAPAEGYLARRGLVVGTARVDAKAASLHFRPPHRAAYAAPLSRLGKT